MNKKVKKMWIAALTSGKYEQGKGQLRNENNKFCCLGVLCNLHAQAHPEIAAKQTRPGKYMGEDSFLPYEVREWAGLDSDDGGYVVCDENATLVERNDDGFSFRKIAKIIQEKF